MRKLAIFTRATVRAGVKEFAGKIVMHVQTLVPFGTTVHEIKLAEFHFSGWQGVVRVRTVVASVALSLHVIDAYRVWILIVIVALISTVIAFVSHLPASFVFAGTIVIFCIVSSTRCSRNFFISI